MISVTDSKPIKENLEMRKRIILLSAFGLLAIAFTACRKKNTEINYQNPVNSVQNLNLLQHTICEFTATYYRAIHDQKLRTTHDSYMDGCYLTLDTTGTADTLFMDYGTGSMVRNRWLKGLIVVTIEGGIDQTGSTASFDFRSFTCDQNNKNIISSDNCTVTLIDKTLTSESYEQTITNFDSREDTLNPNWAAMSGTLMYELKLTGIPPLNTVEDTISVSMTATYSDYQNRTLSSSTTRPAKLSKACSYLSFGESEIQITLPEPSAGTLYCNKKTNSCEVKFEFNMGDHLFKFEQEWMVK